MLQKTLTEVPNDAYLRHETFLLAVLVKVAYKS